MLLKNFFVKILTEGGNLELPNPNDPASPYRADEINLAVHNRSYIIPILDKLLYDINNTFNAQFKTPIWSNQLLASKQFLGGSSLHFFNTAGISDQQFIAKKPKVGDIDTQCNKELEPSIKEFLTVNNHKKVGSSTLLGFSAGNEQYNALFQFENPPIKIQIDFEFGRYSPETNTPDEWFKFSHSSDWDDINAGIKGVFHKYLYRALSGATSKEAYIAKMAGRGKNRSIQISDEPTTINTASFAVSSKKGGGVSQKYVPYVDPTTNKPMIKNGLPVMQEVPTAERDYEQRLDKQFITFFGQSPTPEDSKLQWSFIGTLDLINKYIDNSKKSTIVKDFLDMCFEPGSQMITRDDPKRDAQTKFAAIDLMLEKLGLNSMRPQAIQMAKDYEDEYREVEAYKKAHPGESQPRAALTKLKTAQSLKEADDNQVKAQLRKGMPHLRDLKPADFLDLLDEMQTDGGRFKLQNIPLNVKVDGFGGRFGKNAEGKPFMATSRTEPRYTAGFVDYHKQKGTTDPEILGRAANFDKLFDELMSSIKVVDSELGPDFLVDRQVTCEILFLPFATQTANGKLKFVGIEYNQLPESVELVIVPYRIVEASTGKDIPDGDRVVQQIAELGENGPVSFMSNRLIQKEGLDVTEIINPLENIEELKKIVTGVNGKRDRASIELRKQIEEKLKPVQIALEKAIDEDPNIIGKDMLGQDYEGIVINSRLGPIKVTSQRQKDIITQKNAAKAAARSEQPGKNQNKTAVVAIGSFVGHKGHEELFNYTINKANEVNGDPYLFIGNAVGKDDPIPPETKVQTWHKMYPKYAKNISTVQQGGTLLQKIKHELINPAPGKPPQYDNIIIMVGEDQQNMPIASALMKSVNKFDGYEHVKVSLEATPRGTGMSFTRLRNILKDPNATPEQQYALWSQGFDEAKLGKQWILHLMDLTKKGMGIASTNKLSETRLSTALIRVGRDSCPVCGQTPCNCTYITEDEQLAELNVVQTLKFIQQAHGDQLYGKLPYWQHPKSVALRGKNLFGKNFNSDAIKVAFLHDVVEDTHFSLDDLSKLDFSPEIIEAVGLLTKNKSLTYTQNIEQIISSGNKLAMMVKYADNYENFTGDKTSWDPKKAASSQKKYFASLNTLGDVLGIKQHLGEPQSAAINQNTEQPTAEHIVKVKGGYELKSKKTGKNLGKYPTRAGAEKREQQVQYFKHAKEDHSTVSRVGTGTAIKSPYNKAGYTDDPNWRGFNIGEDVDAAMSTAILKLIESQFK